MRPSSSSALEGRRQRVVPDRQGGHPGCDAISSGVLRRCWRYSGCRKGQQHSGCQAASAPQRCGHSCRCQPGSGAPRGAGSAALSVVLACWQCTVMSVPAVAMLPMLRHGEVGTAQKTPSTHGQRPAGVANSSACHLMAGAFSSILKHCEAKLRAARAAHQQHSPSDNMAAGGRIWLG